MGQEKFRLYSLVSADGRTCATIVPELGGIVSSLVLPDAEGNPRECLYRHRWFWNSGAQETRGGIPLLFPICGRLLRNGVPGLYHAGGTPYVLPIHGFAMRLPWEVVEASKPDALRLRLADSAPTRKVYPFAFELQLYFSVSAAGFSCRLDVANPGAAPLPFYAGFHPYFLTPPPGAGKEHMRFAAAATKRLLYNETKTDVIGSAPAPAFPQPVAGGDLNGLLLDMVPRGETRLIFPDGFELRQTASDLFRYRQFYTRSDEPFFCDEPWMAQPGSLNRPGAACSLPPGQSVSGTICITSSRA